MPEICPNCGADVPPKAAACPECGSDAQTGWSEQAREAELGLPDEEFDYKEFIHREFGDGAGKPRGQTTFWWVVAVLLVVLLLGGAFYLWR